MQKVIAIAAFAAAMTTATAAQAKAIGWGSDLRFVANTTVPTTDGSGAMALCHVVGSLDFLFLPVYTVLDGYALSSAGCAGPFYTPLSPEQFDDLQSQGAIPQALSTTPNLSFLSNIWGLFWIIAICVALLAKGLSSILQRGRPSGPATPDTLAIHALVAMSQVAVADGQIDDTQVRQISYILSRLTGASYTPEQVTDLLMRLNPSPSDLAQVGENLSDYDRQIVLEAALNIAVADGEIHAKEYAVVSDLAQRMRIGADAFRGALARISATLQPV